MSWPPPQPERDAVEPEELAAYDRLLARQAWYGYWQRPLGDGMPKITQQKTQPYFGALLNSPLVADAISELGVLMRTRGERPDSYAHADREWVDVVLGLHIGWKIVPWGHSLDAVAVGVRPEAIKAVREGRDEDLTPRERLLADHIRRVADGRVEAESYEEVQQELGVRGAVDYTACIGWLLLTMRLMCAFGVEDKSDAELDERIDALVAGTIELPDPKARVPSLEPVPLPQ
jgi:hypothetical protein